MPIVAAAPGGATASRGTVRAETAAAATASCRWLAVVWFGHLVSVNLSHSAAERGPFGPHVALTPQQCGPLLLLGAQTVHSGPCNPGGELHYSRLVTGRMQAVSSCRSWGVSSHRYFQRTTESMWDSVWGGQYARAEHARKLDGVHQKLTYVTKTARARRAHDDGTCSGSAGSGCALLARGACRACDGPGGPDEPGGGASLR